MLSKDNREFYPTQAIAGLIWLTPVIRGCIISENDQMWIVKLKYKVSWIIGFTSEEVTDEQVVRLFFFEKDFELRLYKMAFAMNDLPF